MDPEIIDWVNIESKFEEDERYENFDAPKWVDLSARDRDERIRHDSWFCSLSKDLAYCTHSHSARDFANKRLNSKVKRLRSISISEILPFGDQNRRDVRTNDSNDAKQKSHKAKGFDFSRNLGSEGDENKNPNNPHSISFGKAKSMRNNKEEVERLHENSLPRSRVESRLKSTFSARNLLGGRDIMSQITGFCAELKRFAKNGTKKMASENGSDRVWLGELKQRVRERERMPLLVRQEKNVKQ